MVRKGGFDLTDFAKHNKTQRTAFGSAWILPLASFYYFSTFPPNLPDAPKT
jgi:hypothetical protein